MPKRGWSRVVRVAGLGVAVAVLLAWAGREVWLYNEVSPIVPKQRRPVVSEAVAQREREAAAKRAALTPRRTAPPESPFHTQALREFTGHTDGVWSLAFSPDGRHFASSSNDRTARLWDAETGQLVHTFAGHVRRVGSLAFSPTGKRLITGGDDSSARVWDVKTGEQVAQFDTHWGEVWFVAILPDDRHALVGAHKAELRLWDIETETVTRAFDLKVMDMHHAAISPDGALLAMGSCYGSVSVLDVATGRRLWKQDAASKQISGLAFTPDNSLLISCANWEQPRIWDVASGKESAIKLDVLKDEPCSNLAVSPDGRYLAIIATINDVLVNELPSGRRLQVLRGCADWPHAGAFSPDGRYFVGAGGGYRELDVFQPSTDHMIRLWSMEKTKAAATQPTTRPAPRGNRGLIGTMFR